MIARPAAWLVVLLTVGTGAGAAPADNPRAEVPLAEIAGVPVSPERPIRAMGVQPEVEALYRQARELMAQGEFARAVTSLEQAVNAADGDYWELPYWMAQAKFRLGNLGEARNFAELAALLRPAAVDAHYLLGRIYHRQGQLDRAIAHFRTATLAAAREPDNPHATAAWLELGERLAEAGYWSAACESLAKFDETLETYPQHLRDPEVAALLADQPARGLELRLSLLRRLGRADEVVQVIERAWRQEPEDARLMRLYSRALLEGGRATEALAFCRTQLEAMDEPWLSALVRTAVEAARAADQAESLAAELTAQVAAGQRDELAAAVARRLAEDGQYTPAAELWKAIARQRPQEPGPTWALALALRAAGQTEPALRTLIEFVRANPDVAEIPHATLAAWMSGPVEQEAVRRLVTELSERGEPDFATSFVLATAAAAADLPHLAEKLFGAAVEARPEFALAHVAWGRMLLNQYRWEEAQAQARAALETAPELAAAHFLLAAANDGLDENDEAEEAYRAAMRHQPGELAYVLGLAEHHRRMDRSLAAQRYFQEALAVDPTNDRALENLIESYVAGNKLEIARVQLRKAEAHDVSDDALRRARTALRFAGATLSDEYLLELTGQFEAYPNDAETGLKLADGLYQVGRYEEASRILERIRPQMPEDERRIALVAALLNRRLEFDSAIGLLEELARRYPNRPRVLAQLAESYLIDFRLNEARRLLARLLELNPQERAQQAYRRRLLASYVEPREYDGALALLDRWLADDPDHADWFDQRLWLLSLAERDAEAIELATKRLAPLAERFRQELARFRELGQQLREDPGNRILQAEYQSLQSELAEQQFELVQRREALVEACLRAGEYDTLEPYLRQWLEDEPDDGLAMQWLVELLVADDRAEQAWELLQNFQPATLQAGVAAEGWRARVGALTGRLDEVSQKLISLLEAPSGFLLFTQRNELWQHLIEACRQGRRYDQALQHCDRWFAEVSSADPAAGRLVLRYKCALLAEARRMDEYVELAEKLLEADPSDPSLNNDLGYTWVDAGRNLERGTRMIQRALAADPLRAAYLDSLGWAYYKAGDWLNAQKFLRRAARLREGQDPVIYDHCGDVEYRLGNHEAARRDWHKALELLENEGPDGDVLRPAGLLETVRAKLAALDRSEPVEVAPTAAEQAAASESDAEQ